MSRRTRTTENPRATRVADATPTPARKRVPTTPDAILASRADSNALAQGRKSYGATLNANQVRAYRVVLFEGFTVKQGRKSQTYKPLVPRGKSLLQHLGVKLIDLDRAAKGDAKLPQLAVKLPDLKTNLDAYYAMIGGVNKTWPRKHSIALWGFATEQKVRAPRAKKSEPKPEVTSPEPVASEPVAA